MTLSENLPTVSLSKLIRDAQSGFASGERATDGVIQIRMNNVTTDGNLDWTSFIRIPASQNQIEKYHLLPRDVLFNNTNSPELVGKTTSFQGHKEPVVFSNHFIRLRVDKTRLNAQYLARWLTKQWQLRVFESLCTRWVNQATVRKGDLLALKIPLPPLNKQKHIAAILSKADHLRRLRRYIRELSDGYLQAVFLEMFGNPVLNPRGWKTDLLGSLGAGKNAIVDGPFGASVNVKTDYIQDGEIPVIRSKNIRPLEFVIDDLKFMSQEKFETILRSRVTPGDILLVKVGANLGDTCIFPSKFTEAVLSTTGSCKITPNLKKVNTVYLAHHLYLLKPELQKIASQVAQPFLNMTTVKEIVIALPPLPLQQKFTQIVQKYEHLRAQQREAERQAEHLFQSLLHRAFRGEL